MNLPHTHACDGCGVTKRESNHWFKVIRMGRAVTVWSADRKVRALQHLRALDACGEACANKLLWRLLKQVEAV